MVPSSADPLDQGRAHARREAWADAHRALRAQLASGGLDGPDLETLAQAAYMLGRDDEYVARLEAALASHSGAGRPDDAARCAFWIGHSLLFRGRPAEASGWFDRGRRLVAEAGGDCVAAGYLLAPVWLRQIGRGQYDEGYASAAEAVEIAGRFGDADLVWLARDDQARARMKQGRVEEALGLVAEGLVVASSGALSPVVRGILYCNTIDFCQEAQEVRYAREWTEALSAWCAENPQMVTHNGLCLVHRAEVLQVAGAWDDAAGEARQAAERFRDGVLNRIALGKAHYRQGEIHRLRGEHNEAESCYREATGHGCDPQPGRALLALREGRVDTAAAAVRRAMVERGEPLAQAALLPAYVEIVLAAGDHDAARAACDQLDAIASRHPAEALQAAAAQARAELDLVQGRADAALRGARRAFEGWADLGAPYEAARARVLLGRACRALGDEQSAVLELDAAAATFADLGAVPDLQAARGQGPSRHGLSTREVEVLALMAGGLSNREIGARLVISEHTVARHVQNIFTKLDVRSRTAASTFALEHGLVTAGGQS